MSVPMIVAFLVEGTVIFGFAYWLGRRKIRYFSAASQHQILVFFNGLALLLPLLTIVAQNFKAPTLLQQPVLLVHQATRWSVPESAAIIDVWSWCGWFWLAGVAWHLLQILLSHHAAHRLSRNLAPPHANVIHLLEKAVSGLGQLRRPRLGWTDEVHTPALAGIWQPCILLPRRAATWESKELNFALCHEVAHWRRSDLLMLTFGQIVCSFYWFHPLAWWTQRNLRLAQEQAADDEVVLRGAVASEYASFLLDLQQRLAASPVKPALARRLQWSVSLLDRQPLLERIESMLDTQNHRRISSRKTLFFGLGTVLVVSAAIAAMQGSALASDTYVAANGALEKDVIRPIVQAQEPAIRQCYLALLAGTPTAAGQWVTRFKIESTGHTSAVQVQSSDFSDATFNECLRQVFVGLSFPPSQGGGSSSVTYPLAFSPN